jgi:hypothetical protein
MNLSRLFQRRAIRPGVYPSVRAELDAVASGRKGMSIFGFGVDELASGDYRTLVRQALARDLVSAHAASGSDRKHVRVYVARADQLWRIPAHLALWETAIGTGSNQGLGWSESSEALEGLLLGYTASERARWLAARRQRFASDRGANVYALLTRAQKQAIVAAGKRCLGDTSTLRLFAHSAQMPMVARASRLIPAGTTLARFGLAWQVYRRIFGTPDRWRVVIATISDALAPVLHAAMTSNVQFLTSRGWA